jgi:hypothetical protein
MSDEQQSLTVTPIINVSNSNEDSGNGDEEIQGGASGNEAHSDGDTSNGGSPLAGNDEPPLTEAIAVASIEAERDVALAEIHSDVERERIALEAERIENENRELAECQRQIQELTERVEALSLLIPPLVSETVQEEVTEQLEIVEEANLTPQSIVVPTAETQTEHSEESVEERLEEAIPSRVRRFIAI